MLFLSRIEKLAKTDTASYYFCYYGLFLKEPLINLDEFWQRQVSKFETLVLSIVILWLKPITKKLGTWLSPAG